MASKRIPKDGWPMAAILLAACIFAFSVFRAARQSITYDEAFTANTFLGSAADLFNRYEANHHVLNTFLEFASVKAFGISELTLRLPALAGAVLFLIAVLRICRLLVPAGGAQFFVAVALTVVNPLVLDFLAAARGYGLALGFFAWALYFVLRDARAGAAGVCAGLSIAANLTFLFPCAALAAVAVIEKRRVWAVLDGFAGPAAVTAAVVIAVPLSHYRAGQFDFGSRTLGQMLETLMKGSLVYLDSAPFFPALTNWYWFVVKNGSMVVGAAFSALAFVVGAAAVARARREPADDADWHAAAIVGTLGLSLAGVVAAHAAAGMPYPYTRTGLYLVTLFALSVVSTWRWLIGQGRRTAGRVVMTGAVAATLLMAVQNRGTYFYDWRADASTKRFLAAICAHPAIHRTELRLACSSSLRPALQFYAKLWRLSWVQVQAQGGLGPGWDVYMIADGDRDTVAKLKLREIRRDPVSRTRLAVPSP